MQAAEKGALGKRSKRQNSAENLILERKAVCGVPFGPGASAVANAMLSTSILKHAGLLLIVL